MSRLINSFIVLLLIVPLLFVGCASPGPKVADAPVEEVPPQAQLKVSEYIFGIGDSFDVTIYRNDDLKTSAKISPSGMIIFPLIGEIQVAGKSISALREELKERFSKYLVDPQITISVTNVQSSKVVVLGEVKVPGVYTLDTDLSIIDAVAKAGGWTADANMNNIILLSNVSGKVDTRTLDMETSLEKSNLSRNSMLHKNDIVYVPTKKIADIARFMTYISSILSPIVLTESVLVLGPQAVKVLEGKSSSTSLSVTSH